MFSKTDPKKCRAWLDTFANLDDAAERLAELLDLTAQSAIHEMNLRNHANIGAGSGDEEGYVHPDVLATQSKEFQEQYAARNDTQKSDEATVKACIKAIRARAQYLEDAGYAEGTKEMVRHIAYWLASDVGREAIEAAFNKK